MNTPLQEHQIVIYYYHESFNFCHTKPHTTAMAEICDGSLVRQN